MKLKRPFFVDPQNPGVIRGGFYDVMGGMVVGQHASEVCDVLNKHSDLEREQAQFAFDAGEKMGEAIRRIADLKEELRKRLIISDGFEADLKAARAAGLGALSDLDKAKAELGKALKRTVVLVEALEADGIDIPPPEALTEAEALKLARGLLGEKP